MTTDTNGSQPVTQVTRDQMAQNDHDQLVRLSVMLENIMAGQIRLEQQIKDLISGQAAALAGWEAKSDAVHETHDMRIKKIEELALIWVPKATIFESDIEKLKTDIQIFKDVDNKFLGGWKILVFIGGMLAGVVGLIISVIDIIVHAPK